MGFLLTRQIGDQAGIVSPYNNIMDTFLHNISHDFYPSGGGLLKVCEIMDLMLYKVPIHPQTGEPDPGISLDGLNVQKLSFPGCEDRLYMIWDASEYMLSQTPSWVGRENCMATKRCTVMQAPRGPVEGSKRDQKMLVSEEEATKFRHLNLDLYAVPGQGTKGPIKRPFEEIRDQMELARGEEGFEDFRHFKPHYNCCQKSGHVAYDALRVYIHCPKCAQGWMYLDTIWTKCPACSTNITDYTPRFAVWMGDQDPSAPIVSEAYKAAGKGKSYQMHVCTRYKQLHSLVPMVDQDKSAPSDWEEY